MMTEAKTEMIPCKPTNANDFQLSPEVRKRQEGVYPESQREHGLVDNLI